MYEWLLIAGMALLTFLPRYLPMGIAGRIRLSVRIERLLAFIPIAILSAMVAPTTLIRQGEIDLTLSNYQLLAAATAISCALLTRRLLPTMISGLAVFALLKLFAS
ncbi:AzlD domain-containing protein [Marinobacterium jannaschii]|uniref:AzlD domain-containing protein n=1 Tax=Marinobacterium jannaschii TaxID=64970 RepID=UPI0004894102|nr:AzlD domain-containing protein [Marinobacterium jannaschii]